jgi:hypothetical protein
MRKILTVFEVLLLKPVFTVLVGTNDQTTDAGKEYKQHTTPQPQQHIANTQHTTHNTQHTIHIKQQQQQQQQ